MMCELSCVRIDGEQPIDGVRFKTLPPPYSAVFPFTSGLLKSMRYFRLRDSLKGSGPTISRVVRCSSLIDSVQISQLMEHIIMAILKGT